MSSGSLLALLAACMASLANAQTQGENVGIHNLTIQAGACGRFRLGSVAQERASYSVVTFPPLTEGCLDQQIRQSLPQSTKNFALASYDAVTPCSHVLKPTPRPNSYTEDISLEFEDTSSLAVQGLTYHVCTDVSWETGIFGLAKTVGPVDTYLWFHNPCNQPATVTFNTSRLDDEGPAERYCEQLQHQNDGEQTVAIVVYLGRVVASILFLFGLCLCTSGCTSCCCCARENWCSWWASPCSEGCYKCFSKRLLCCGCGWCMGKDGGIEFYTVNPKRSLLFWTFGTTCMYSFFIMHLPQFSRDDTINPDFGDSRTTWSSEVPGGSILFLQFLSRLLVAASAAVLPYGAIVLAFSDPLRDKSYRSKVIVAGIMIVLGVTYAALTLVDIWRYFSSWDFPGQQIILQLGLILMEVMSLVSYIRLVHEARLKRVAVRKEHGGRLPDLLPGRALTGRFPALAAIPVAHVVQRSDGGDPPAATVAPVFADVMRDDDAPVAVEMCAAQGPVGGHEQEGRAHVTGDSQDNMLQPRAILPYTANTGAVAEGVECANEKQTGDASWVAPGRSLGMAGELVSNSAHRPSAPPNVPEDSAEATVKAQGKWRSVMCGIWDSVREDPRSGFRYSVFVGASLLLTFIALTASFMRAVHLVHELAACSESDSRCLYDVQRFVYKRLVRNFVRVDANTLELQATGMCRVVNSGDSRPIDLLDERWDSNLATAEVVQKCAEVQQLESSQAEFEHPDWLANARVPVLVGGYIGFIAAYFLGLYTIFHVARAYKKLELKLKAAKLAEVLWEKRTADLSELASAAASSSAATAVTHKTKLGRDIVEDYKSVKIGQSAYFTGMLVSTCFVQLWLAGLLLGTIVMLLLHPQFWELVAEYYEWPVSIVLIILWHILSQLALNNWVTGGKHIKWPFWWLFLYVGLSAGYCVVSVFLALVRLIKLILTSIVALSRLDECLYTVMKGEDRGYASFLAMALMLHSFQECLLEKKLCNEDGPLRARPGDLQSRHEGSTARDSRHTFSQHSL